MNRKVLQQVHTKLIKKKHVLMTITALSFCLSLSSAAQATKSTTAASSQSTTVAGAADSANKSQAQDKTVTLGDNIATVNLTPQYRFVDQEKARKFLAEQGASGANVLGIIAPVQSAKENYFIVCCFDDVGYIKDDDADKLNADEILKTYKEGTAEQNQERKEHNIPPIFVGNWAEKPFYDKASHHVIWALEIKDQDSPTAPVASVNYNTRILGRRGVLSMNLVCDPSTLDADKVKVKEILQKTSFIKGQTYAEYIPGKDKLAEYGLAGLILGGGAMAAAAKFGVFGALWKWGLGLLLVMKKFIIIAVAGLGAFLSRLFKKKNQGTTPGAGANVEPPNPPEL